MVIDFSRLEGNSFKTWWYNPRTGEATVIREINGHPRERFVVPVAGVDWVLVIDNMAYDFFEPGNTD